MNISGEISIVPALDKAEIDYLQAFSQTRHVMRKKGQYHVDPENLDGSDITDNTRSGEGQPGPWCQLVVTEDGKFLKWNGNTTFYRTDQWVAYLINHFLSHEPLAKTQNSEQFSFLQGHNLNGDMRVEEDGDEFILSVKNNIVSVKDL